MQKSYDRRLSTIWRSIDLTRLLLISIHRAATVVLSITLLSFLPVLPSPQAPLSLVQWGHLWD